MISARNVTKRFGEFVALDDVSVDVPSGALMALLGPSGSGKSTLLRVIAGLEKPDAGEVFISGREATQLPPQQRGVGFVFQHYAPFKHMTVADNVAFGLRVRRRPKDEIRRRVHELLELVQLEGLGKRYPAQLSGGQRQRMALARALAVEPEVLLLDEPFGALDARVRQELRDWLRRLHDEVHVTTVFVTHDQEEAMQIADHIVLVNHGRVEQIGTPQDLYERPANEFVLTFVGEATQFRGELVRPHDVVLSTLPEDGAEEALVERLAHLGFEVRVQLVLGDGQRFDAQITHDEAERLELARGQIGRAFVLELLGPDAAHVRERALDGTNHIRERDLGGRAREPVTPFRTALARDEPGVLEFEQDLLEEAERDRLRAGERLRLDVPLAQ